MSGRELPSTWTWCEFGGVAKVVSDLVDPQLTPDAPHVAPNHVSSWTGELIEKSTVRNDGVTSQKHRFNAGQIVYSKIRPYLAKAIVADFDGLCSADMYPINAEIDARFLLRWMLSRDFTEAASQSQGRTILPKINQDALQKLPVPVPPLPEQRRIVEKIEALTARSRRVREALDALPTLIDRYRQSILAAAFRGDLTAEWRSGKEPDLPDSSEERPGSLPSEWRWQRLDTSGIVSGGLTKNKNREQLSLRRPYLRVANVYANEIRLDDIQEIGIAPQELNRVILQAGDLLIVEGNGSLDQVGRVAIWDGQVPDCVHQNHIIKVRFPDRRIAEFVLLWLQSPLGRRFIEQEASSSAGLHTLSLSKVSRLPMPIPSIKEAEAVVIRVRDLFQNLSRLSILIGAASNRLSTLDQSILAKAFRGELVPQDPNDEPASVLLERIRAERAAAGASPRRGRRART